MDGSIICGSLGKATISSESAGSSRRVRAYESVAEGGGLSSRHADSQPTTEKWCGHRSQYGLAVAVVADSSRCGHCSQY